MNRKDLEEFIENLDVEELKQYYFSHTFDETRKHFGLSQGNLSEIRKRFQIKLPESVRVGRIKATKLERHGDPNYNNIEKVKSYFRYEMPKEELYDMYIVQNMSLNDIAEIKGVHRGKISTLVKEYGIEKPPELRYAAREKKTQQTNIEKYGVPHAIQCDECKQHLKETMLKNYGVEYFAQSQEFRDICADEEYMSKRLNKCYETKNKNNTFHTSKPEEEFKNKLYEQYGKDNVKHHYKDKERYPFWCDFYIPSEDLFIELNAHWTHGGKPFDPNDKECQEKLALWQEKSKTSKFYENAIKTWTVRDTEKKKVAEENNLNIQFIY